jgi:DMSO/TMAO reductase YedYZ heme-binding membrane subunit
MTAVASTERTTARPRSLTLPLCAGAFLLGTAAIAAGHAAGATPDEAWRFAARFTARLAFLLFLVPFTASSWHRLAPSAASRFVLKRRRSFGLAFATAHTVHLGALTTFQVTTSQVPEPVTLIFGGGAFVAMFALVATSNDAAVRRLGRNWRRLHLVGIYWLWFVFTFSYFGRVAEGQLFFVPLFALAVGALGLRIAAARVRKRTQEARAA